MISWVLRGVVGDRILKICLAMSTTVRSGRAVVPRKKGTSDHRMRKEVSIGDECLLALAGIGGDGCCRCVAEEHRRRSQNGDAAGGLKSFLTNVTDLLAKDAFEHLAAGRSAFRVDDLLELRRCIDRHGRHAREAEDA